MLATTSVGVDVAKRHLDVHLLPHHRRLRVSNTPEGHAELIRWIEPHAPDRVVLESTGGYERPLLHALLDVRQPATLIDPAQARSYARAARRNAKNDRQDAQLLAEFATCVQTRLASPHRKMMHVLKQLIVRRRQIVDLCVQLRNHLEHADHPAVRASIDRSIKSMREELKTVDALVQQQIDRDPKLSRRQQQLRCAVGVGPTVSAVLISELPELGTLHRSKLAALVGVAPFDDDSGDRQSPRHIRGGRRAVRAALYMATLVGVRRDPHLRAHYQQLLARGKPKKVALVACMNKRLSYFNSLLRSGSSDDDDDDLPTADTQTPRATAIQ